MAYNSELPQQTHLFQSWIRDLKTEGHFDVRMMQYNQEVLNSMQSNRRRNRQKTTKVNRIKSKLEV